MNRKKIFKPLLLFAMTLAGTLFARGASNVSINGIVYNVVFNVGSNSATASVIGYYDVSGDLVIPSTIPVDNGGGVASVLSIGYHAFYQCYGLTSVTIPNTVTYIGSCAFCRCNNLTSVNIGNSVTYIGADAFNGTRLTSLTIGNSVTSIDEWAFFDIYNGQCVTVKCLGKIPPVWAHEFCFDVIYSIYFGGKLLVPVGTTEIYKSTNYWNKFDLIFEIIPGDLDGDGLVAINDVTDLIDILLTGGNHENADVNGDGIVSINDVTNLIDILLTGSN